MCVLLKKQLLAGAPGLISSTSTHRDYREEIPENQKKKSQRAHDSMRQHRTAYAKATCCLIKTSVIVQSNSYSSAARLLGGFF